MTGSMLGMVRSKQNGRDFAARETLYANLTKLYVR
jgi:hypothetical protein